MAFNWQQLLSQLGTSAVNAGTTALTNRLFGLNNQGFQIGNTTIPNYLAGGGLLLGSSLLDREPGEVGEARQHLRNEFTSPEAIPTRFNQLVGGFESQFRSRLNQIRQRGIDDISQRFAAAFPSTVGAQGPEFGALSRYITEEAAPQEQAFMGQLGLSGLNLQDQAARTILDTSRPNPFAESLGQLGGLLMARDFLNPAGGPGLGLTGSGSPFTGGGQLISQLGQAVMSANTTGNLSQLAQLLSSGVLQGQPFPFGIQASTPAGQLVQQAINAGLVESPAAQLTGQAATAGMDFGLAGPGLLGAPSFSSASGIASGVGSAGLGYMIGRSIGGAVDRNQPFGGRSSAFVSAGGGAAGGAAAGFAVGGPVGAVIGAIAGGFGGIFGERSARHERKEGQLAAEAAETAQQRPAVLASINELQVTGDQLRSEFESQRPQVVNDLTALFTSNDPAVQQAITQLRQIEQSTGATASFELDPARRMFEDPDLRSRASNLANWIANLFSLGRGSTFRGGDAESTMGLLQSSETGKFGPGAAAVQRELALFSQAVPVVNQLLQYARSRGGV